MGWGGRRNESVDWNGETCLVGEELAKRRVQRDVSVAAAPEDVHHIVR